MKKRHSLCLGGATAIAPFVSFAQHLHDIGDKREIIVLHGASYVDELSYKELFTILKKKVSLVIPPGLAVDQANLRPHAKK